MYNVSINIWEVQENPDKILFKKAYLWMRYRIDTPSMLMCCRSCVFLSISFNLLSLNRLDWKRSPFSGRKRQDSNTVQGDGDIWKGSPYRMTVDDNASTTMNV